MDTHCKRFFNTLISVALVMFAVLGTASAATTISTNISTGGTLSVAGQSSLGNASTTHISTTGSIWVNGLATTTGSTGAFTTQGALTIYGLSNVIGGIRSQPSAGGQSNERYGGGTLGAIQSSATGNTALGEDALMSLTTGDNNVGLGYQALRLKTTGNRNIGAGVFSLYYNETGSNNVALGYSAGLGVSTNSFSNNIFVGFQAADNVTTGSNNIAIGYDIDLPSASASNQLTIGNLIFGTGVDGTGAILSSGNVGIGTTTPYAKLSVAGPVVGTYFTGSSATISTLAGGLHLSNGDLRVATLANCNTIDTDATGLFACGTDATSGTITGTQGQVTYFNGIDSPIGTSTLFIASNQNVGMGTTTTGTYQGVPAKLDISTSGHTLVNINSALAATAGLNFSENGSAKWGMVSYNTYNSPNNRLSIVTGVSAEVLTISSAGNVGVGTTSPGTKLHLEGASSNSAVKLRETTSNTTALLGFVDTSGNFAVDLLGANFMSFTTNSTERMRMTSSGDIGIGTSSPAAKLAVEGNVLVNGNITLANSSTPIGGIVFGYCTITNSATIATSTSGYFDCTTSVSTSAAHRVFVQATSSLPSTLFIQAASSTSAGIINLQIYNAGSPTAPGAISVNFFGIR